MALDCACGHHACAAQDLLPAKGFIRPYKGTDCSKDQCPRDKHTEQSRAKPDWRPHDHGVRRKKPRRAIVAPAIGYTTSGRPALDRDQRAKKRIMRPRKVHRRRRRQKSWETRVDARSLDTRRPRCQTLPPLLPDTPRHPTTHIYNSGTAVSFVVVLILSINVKRQARR